MIARNTTGNGKAFRTVAPALAIFLLTIPFETSIAQGSAKYWVYFTDKGPSAPSQGAIPANSRFHGSALAEITGHALARRAKMLPADALIDFSDLPLNEDYLVQVRSYGATLVEESRWMNAASFYLPSKNIQSIVHLPFVEKVTNVMSYHRTKELEQTPVPQQLPAGISSGFDYGPSYNQVAMMNVLPLHTMGITGNGIVVGMLDSGFRWRTHEALQTRNVIAEHDFIFNDNTTANEAVDISDQDFHGTLTMSLVGGYMPGQLIAPAFDVSFILGKTEDLRSETRIEEDHWAAAIEWMERNGVDVISSSLGYDVFNDGTGYTWTNGDFNGRTSVTARAAVRAARLGVVVCNSMGNQGFTGDGIEGTLITPADADSIISVGAVTYARTRASFSSTGPTNDGRIKPDVVAPGTAGDYGALPPNNYTSTTQGTSLSTPLTAGVAALILSARPELTPIQVRDALRASADTIDVASYPSHPNNFTGWGLVNAFNAALSFGPIFSNEPSVTVVDSSTVVSIDVVSRNGILPGGVVLHYGVEYNAVFDTLSMQLDSSMFFPTSGRYSVSLPSYSAGTRIHFTIVARDSSSETYESPSGITLKEWHMKYGVAGVTSGRIIPERFELRQNYPNPFNGRTHIEYDLLRTEHVVVRIYTLLGKAVAELVNEVQEAGTKYSVAFDGANLPSGVYFYRLQTPSFSSTRKMMLIR